MSISRTSFKWGVSVEGNSDHIMYVWIDALVNYLTSLGYPDLKEKKEYWKECIHIIGKDILKFHAVYWPAMLMAANLPLPKKIFAHGWWTNEGKKISKSLGNTIDPNKIIGRFGLDQFRYFLLREVTLGQDGDFSEKALKSRVNSDLSNNFGNLVQRTLKFLFKNFQGVIPFQLDLNSFNNNPLKDAYLLFPKVEKLIINFELNKGIDEVFVFVSKLNKYMDESEPWNLIKNDRELTGKILTELIEGLRIVGIILQPFLPIASKLLLDTLNVSNKLRTFEYLYSNNSLKKGHKLNEPKALFPRFE